MLHANFVVAVLSDLFGIQARSGCFCAGPYIHRAYPIDDAWSRRMHAEVGRGHLGAKLAFTRLSFPYYTSEAAFAYVLAAVHLLADQGWKLLPQYRFDPDSGLWEHRARAARRRGRLAGDARRAGAAFARAPESVLPAQLNIARSILRAAGSQPTGGRHDEPPCSPDFERIRWFPLPDEGLARLPGAAA